MKENSMYLNEIMNGFNFLEKWEQDEVVEEVVDKFKPLLVSCMMKFFGRYDEDIMQDCILELLERTYAYDPKRGVDFVGYIHNFMSMFFLKYSGNFYKKKEKVFACDDEFIDSFSCNDSYDFEVCSLMDCLDERQRYVIVENIFNGESLKNIGNNLGVSYATVKRIKSAAIDKIRICLI